MEKRVTVYSSPTWAPCRAVKEFLSHKGIAFIAYNVAEDEEARERLKQLTGRMATPVITVDDEIVVGFDRGKLQRLLGVWSMLQADEPPCPGCGEAIDISSCKEGDLMECASCADLTLKLVRQEGKLTLKQIHRVSCPLCDKQLEVPEDAQPGDTMSCCGQTFRLTYEFGAYALEWAGPLHEQG